MEWTPIGDTTVLVVRLRAVADGTWSVHIDGSKTFSEIPLAPATLIVQLWRPAKEQVLRGTVELYGSHHRVAFQSGAQLMDLIRTWLLSDSASD